MPHGTGRQSSPQSLLLHRVYLAPCRAQGRVPMPAGLERLCKQLPQAQEGHQHLPMCWSRLWGRVSAPLWGSYHTGQRCFVSLENLALLTH